MEIEFMVIKKRAGGTAKRAGGTGKRAGETPKRAGTAVGKPSGMAVKRAVKASAVKRAVKAVVPPLPGAVPAGSLDERFDRIDLKLTPPIEPMEATMTTAIPREGDLQFEPKWDGFRCVAFKDGRHIGLQSKSGQSLGRYFPELMEAFAELPAQKLVVDGEIVIIERGQLAFDNLLQRIHPAASRVAALAAKTPALFMAFDLLIDAAGRLLAERPLSERRRALEELFEDMRTRSGRGSRIRLSPASTSRADAERWMRTLAASNFDGVVAKRLDMPYRFGDRSGMLKVKRARTADCMVGGFRYARGGKGGIGSLLLGLYNDEGLLDHVGFTSSFTERERANLKALVEPFIEPPGFTGKAPGGPSRWNPEGSSEWYPLRTALVVEVGYDHFTGDRFRHGTKLLRWRPEKAPEQCTFEQVRPRGSTRALAALGLS